MANALTTSDTALAEMSPELKKNCYNPIVKELDSLGESAVMGRYKIGTFVLEASKEAKYGDGAVTLLADALKGKLKSMSSNLLWDCRQLAEKFTPAAIEAIVAKTTRAGNKITYTHLNMLAGLPPAKRKELQKRVFAEDLSTDELSALIKKKVGARSSGGRKVQAPKSLSAGLNQVMKYPDEIQKRVKVWDAHVFEKALQVAPEECDKEFLKQLNEASAKLTAMVDQVQKWQSQLDKATERVKRVIAKGGATAASTNGHASNGQATPAKKKPGAGKSSAERIAAAKAKTTHPVKA